MSITHSKVTHIKQQKYFITSRAVDIIHILIISTAPCDENIFVVLYVSLCYGSYTLL